MRKSIILICFCLFISSGLIAQERAYDYLKETKWGINKNTASGLIGGIIIKYSIAKNAGVFHTFGVELINIVHQNEYGLRSLKTGSFFKLAKQNYFYTIRTQYGRDWTLFKKAPQKGVQIIGMLAIGPSFGLQSPYYLNVNGQLVAYSPTEGSHRDISQIIGSGKILQGLGQSKIVLGANIKTGVSFEVGVFKDNILGIEVGFLIDAYAQKIIIMDELKAQNSALFPTSFMTIFWGSRK